jgi:hypothetical protein
MAAVLICLSSATFAEEAREELIETTAEQLAAARGYEIVESVRSVRRYRGDGWLYVSDKALILQISPTQRYLVELVTRCIGLNTAGAIATTTTGSELTTFDSVLAPGSGMGGMGCPIRNIYKLKKIEEG